MRNAATKVVANALITIMPPQPPFLLVSTLCALAVRPILAIMVPRGKSDDPHGGSPRACATLATGEAEARRDDDDAALYPSRLPGARSRQPPSRIAAPAARGAGSTRPAGIR